MGPCPAKRSQINGNPDMFNRANMACNKKCTRLLNNEKWFMCFQRLPGLRQAEGDSTAAVEGGGFGLVDGGSFVVVSLQKRTEEG